MKRWIVGGIGFILVLLTLHGSFAVPGASFSDSCYNATWFANGDLTHDFKIKNACVGNSVEWLEDVNLTLLGDVIDGEVIMGKNWVYVDSSLRPDLDVPAKLVFENSSFAVQPDVLVDGVKCTACNVSSSMGRVEVVVPGFSNYSLQYRRDFTVYSDYEPELKNKVYQTVDLGDGRRLSQYACIVQVFGKNDDGQWILVQTNPERAVQARILGNPDTNQPESLGYFPTKNGIANTYFRNDNLYGYMNFELVIQCTSNTTSMLVYEEPIMTTYSPAGRSLKSRGVWLTSGDNAFFMTVWIVFGFLVLWVGGMVWRSIR